MRNERARSLPLNVAKSLLRSCEQASYFSESLKTKALRRQTSLREKS